MIAAQCRKDHGAHFVAPISDKADHLIGGLFVDDTDLFHLEMRVNETVHQAHSRLHDGIINGGNLLIATSGTLKPIKWAYYLISFRWKPDGTWAYADNVGKEEFAIGVPLADGSLVKLEHLQVTSTVKMLGLMACLAGSNKASIEQMQSQGQKWVDRIKILSHCNMWFMVDRQFWPCLGYGICNNTTPWNELEECLKWVYWQLLPKGGIRRLAPVILRQMDRGFSGMGCPHPGVKCLVAQITKLLVHYGSFSGIGLEMLVSMKLLITELGMSSQPLCKSFWKYSTWVTHTWLCSSWEKVDKFNITVEIAPLSIYLPQEGDKWCMQAVEETGFTSEKEKEIINLFQCYQEVIHLSDVFDAGGQCLDKKYLDQLQPGQKW